MKSANYRLKLINKYITSHDGDYWEIMDVDDILNDIDYLIHDKELRVCSECAKPMYQGYCINDGCEYYCCDECLHANYTDEEYNKMYNSDDAYYTEW